MSDPPTFDLASFFHLTDEEVRSLGLDAGTAGEGGQLADGTAKANGASLAHEAGSHGVDALPTDPALVDVLAEGMLGDTGQLAAYTEVTSGDDGAPGGISTLTMDGLPEHAEDLPWPTEEEMFAAGPEPGAGYIEPPPGVRPWVSVPVEAVLSPVGRDEGRPRGMLEPLADDRISLHEQYPDASPGSGDGGSPERGNQMPGLDEFEAMGRGPYGLTEEQLAELGPDILRELDLAMAASLPTMPLLARAEAATAGDAEVSATVGPAPTGAVPTLHALEAWSALSVPAGDAIAPAALAAPPAVSREEPEDPAATPAVAATPVLLEQPAVQPGAGVGTPAEAQHAGPSAPSSTPLNGTARPVADGAGETPAAPAGLALSGLAQELLSVFMEEAIEMLDSLHASLETLERAKSAAAVIEARRTVHTIKGGARMCGLPALTDLAHACEDMIGPALSGADTLPRDLIALLFAAEQEMRAALAAPGTGPGSEENLRVLAAQLRDARTPAPQPSAQAPQPSAQVHPDAAQAQPPPPLETGDPSRADVPPVPSEAALAFTPASGLLTDRSLLLRRPAITSVSPQGNRLAVDLQKVEGMVAKVTEIVANRAASHGLVETLSTTVTESMRTVHRLQAIATQLQYQIVSQGLDITAEHDPDGLALETYGPLRQLLLQLQEAVADQQALVQATMDIVTNKRALAAIETRLDTDLQGALLNMRLLPLSQLRVRLDQVVRSTSATAGREVRWTLEGQNVALDKHVCDKLFEPLMHLLRNAIDHGIEPPEEREAKGKPRIGRIVVHASVEGNQALVSVSDDGKGMDPAQIAGIAVARGVISQEQAQAFTDREKLELVFRPGFSTAQAVTELSGRGMGMEIVREACIRMGGTVAIGSRPGGGTVITLQVPLSMSVVHALIVRDGGRLLCIPASQVVSVHLVRPAALVSREHGQAVRMGREELALYRLPPGPAAARCASADTAGEFSVLIVPYRSGQVALAVDEMVNEEDLIVKPLPLLLQGVHQLLGAVVLADGVPAPVLNLPPLLDQVIAGGVTVPPAKDVVASGQVVLVVDDSLTMRVALAQTLGHAGYTVLAARDGQEAIELIRLRGVPQLVTLDIEMPRMDGLETLYAIRHTPGGETIPIFMLTSRAGQKHKRTALTLGATRYFTKPYHDREFLRAVQEATGMPLASIG